jgi:hypothetical protein
MNWLAPLLRRHPYAITSAFIVVACSLPTGNVCGCPPAVSSVIVAGRAQSTARVSVRVARVEFSGMPVTRRDTSWSRSELVSGSPTFSDTLGVFRARLLSPSSPGMYVLRMRVVSNALRDTTNFDLGTVRFAAQGEPPDSIYIPAVVP